MVIAYGRLRGGEHRFVFDHVRACVEAARVPVKAILETSALTDLEIAQGALIAAAAGAAFVKTSTGFGAAGATERHVMLMRRAVGPLLGVKASGGIRTQAQAHAMLRAGANRIGASALASEAPTAKGY
jgi:deoxyribose-phosphate aldolase